MHAQEMIAKKRDGGEHSLEELEAWIHHYIQGKVPDYQMSAWLMAVTLRGMTTRETSALTRAMWQSGESLPRSASHRNEFWIDKHSTGGVGDKTSLILVPWLASVGQSNPHRVGRIKIPMVSGRGLGHTGGTLDKLEAVPRFSTHLTISSAMELLDRSDFFMMGQTERLAPADRLLYALRDVTATVECQPLIVSSIMSKKLAESLDGIVLDVKQGLGAMMKAESTSRKLAHALVDVCHNNRVEAVAIRSNMDEPLGWAIGNLIEVFECWDLLEGRSVDTGLFQLSLELVAQMLRVASKKTLTIEACRELCEAEWRSQRPVNHFRKMLEQQGGDWVMLQELREKDFSTISSFDYRATHAGYLHRVEPRRTADLVNRIGGGRARKEDTIDPLVGMRVLKKVGDSVRENDLLARVYYREPSQLKRIEDEAPGIFLIHSERCSPTQWILETIE